MKTNTTRMDTRTRVMKGSAEAQHGRGKVNEETEEKRVTKQKAARQD